MKHRSPKLRLSSLFKRQNKPSSLPEATPPQRDEASVPTPVVEDYNDRERALARYREATNVLSRSIENRPPQWGSFDLPGLAGDPEDFDDAQFRNKINLVITSKEASIKDRKSLSKCRNAIECLFTALSPFSKNFLTIAKEGQSVPSPLFNSSTIHDC